MLNVLHTKTLNTFSQLKRPILYAKGKKTIIPVIIVTNKLIASHLKICATPSSS